MRQRTNLFWVSLLSLSCITALGAARAEDIPPPLPRGPGESLAVDGNGNGQLIRPGVVTRLWPGDFYGSRAAKISSGHFCSAMGIARGERGLAAGFSF
jgi:hypothetical protein